MKQFLIVVTVCAAIVGVPFLLVGPKKNIYYINYSYPRIGLVGAMTVNLPPRENGDIISSLRRAVADYGHSNTNLVHEDFIITSIFKIQ